MFRVNIARNVLLVSLIFFGNAVSFTAFAVVSLPIGTKKISRSAQLPSERTHTRLARAHTLMASEDYKGALSILSDLEKSAKNRPNEYAQILQTLGYVYAHLENTAAASKAFNDALALETLPESPTLATMYTLAQLYLMQKKYDEAIAVLREWFSYTTEPSAESFVLLATAYIEKKQYQEALPLVRQGISMQKSPNESWLQLQVAAEFALKEYNAAAATLRILVQSFPAQKKYLKQLSGVYLSINDNKRALAVNEVAYIQNYFEEETEFLNLANLYLLADIPLRAAQVLEKEMSAKKISANEKNLTLLATSWHRARELDKAIVAYIKAGDVSASGQLYVTAGQLHAESEDWANAVKLYEKALKKGGVKSIADLDLNLGIAKYHLSDVGGAIKSFEKALVASTPTRNQAESWLAFVRSQH